MTSNKARSGGNADRLPKRPFLSALGAGNGILAPREHPRYAYAVTFERATFPPVTIRGQVQGCSPRALVARAMGAAKQEAKGQRWESLVVLISPDA